MAGRNPRSKAQRATAKAVREHRRQLPPTVTSKAVETRTEYLDYLLAHPEARPPKDSIEGRGLARVSSLASWNKADVKYLPFGAEYWYHDKESQSDESDEDYYVDYDDEDE